MSCFLKRGFAAAVVFCGVLFHPSVVLGQSLTITTLAGLAGATGSNDGTGSAARFSSPHGVATDSSGNIYVADESTIRKITPEGAVTTFAGVAGSFGSTDGTITARFDRPRGVATDSSGNVYVADTDNSTIRKINAAGVVVTFAGVAGLQGSVDGTAITARFSLPRGVATDSSGNVYVADSGNSTIRKITPAGEVTTLAGFAGSTGNADGMQSAARFNRPIGVATDSNFNVYVADTESNTIRKISPAGAVTTLAGVSGPLGGSADGQGITARFNFPFGVAVDSSGNVFVADTSNTTIRKITPSGAVTTVAGLAGTGGSVDGTGSAARFNQTRGVATHSSGKVYVADFNNTIRVGTPNGDADGNGGLAVADIFYLINNLFAGGPTSAGRGDADLNGAVQVGDIFYLINFLFAGGPAPL